jgi:S-adenosylmethionine:tRNA ribosyltransferase-isomerase
VRPADFLSRYSYALPEELIAKEPASPRDSSRLLSYDAKEGSIRDLAFSDLPDILPEGALLVMNETRVIPARIGLRKKTGGKLSIGDRLFLGEKEVCAVASQDENLFGFSLSLAPSDFISILESEGVMPIPKYIKQTPLREKDLKERYQTVFAKDPGSVAAPTASLHFTEGLFEGLERKGVRIARLTLHVGAGTFAPLTERELSSGKLHSERFTIPQETLEAIREAKKDGRPVIPVGTTALRAVETVGIVEGNPGTIASSTDIFIRKPYAFKVADGLITNFHVPESSLMCLVDAFLDFKGSPKGILEIYEHAIRRRYRFFSFGDAMLIL